MVITLELPIRHTAKEVVASDPFRNYEVRFGALPIWLEDIAPGAARSLARQALRAGVPLTPADDLS